ncbi:MAG: hypothetical protein ACM3ZE_11350 [Myxococcales bacterium]
MKRLGFDLEEPPTNWTSFPISKLHALVLVAASHPLDTELGERLGPQRAPSSLEVHLDVADVRVLQTTVATMPFPTNDLWSWGTESARRLRRR